MKTSLLANVWGSADKTTLLQQALHNQKEGEDEGGEKVGDVEALAENLIYTYAEDESATNEREVSKCGLGKHRADK